MNKTAIILAGALAASILSRCGASQSRTAQCVDQGNRIISPSFCSGVPTYHWVSSGYYNNGYYHGGRGYRYDEPLPKKIKKADEKTFKKATKAGASSKPKDKKKSKAEKNKNKSANKSKSSSSRSHSSARSK